MLLNNICNDVTQTSVTNMLQQQHVPVAPATTTLLQHPVTCTLSIHRVVRSGAPAMPAWFKDLAELYCSGRHHWSGRSFAEEACGAVARATSEAGDIEGLASAFAELQRPFTRAEGDEAHPHDDRSSVYDATSAISTIRRRTPGTPPRSPRRAPRAGPRTPADPRSARLGRNDAPFKSLPSPSLSRLSKRRATPSSARPAAARHPRRAPPTAAPGPMRYDRAHERRRRKAAVYLAFRQRVAPPNTTTTSPTTPGGAGCSTDPFVPHGKYEYGNESIRYWDGLVVSAERAPDPDGHGTGLRYIGEQPLDRGRLVGVYLADVKITALALRTRTATAPLQGEHAVESCGWALLDKQGRSAISRANESSRPNIELTEIDVYPEGDEPSFTLLAMISIATVQPGEWLTTDYGPDYDRVRAARRYERPYNHARDGQAVHWLTPAELDQRVRILREALSPGQLEHAQRWGGILDHAGKAGTRSDPNRARGEPTNPATPPPPVPSPPASPPASEQDDDEEVEDIEEVEVELEFEVENLVLEVVVDALAPCTPTRPPAPRSSTMASNTAVLASPSASTPRAAGGTLGARACASLEWAGSGPAPRGLEVIYLAAGTTRLITARDPGLDGDDGGGTYDIYVSPPGAETGWCSDYEVRITSERLHPRGQDAPTLLISWLSAWGRPLSSGDCEPTITTVEASACNTFGVETQRLSHGEIIAYGTPNGYWSGSTLLTPHLATTRLYWAFRLNVHSEPPLEPGPPGWPRRPPQSTPGHSEPGRRRQTSHLLFEASGSTAAQVEWARRFIASRTPASGTAAGGDSQAGASAYAAAAAAAATEHEHDAPRWPPPPSPTTSPPASEDEEETEARAVVHATSAPHGATQITTEVRPSPSPDHQPRPTCKLEGCMLPCYPRRATAPGTQGDAVAKGWHDYCGRTHACIAIADRRAPSSLAPVCAVDGCERNAWRRSDEEGGGYHNCCGKQCALRLAAASSAAARAAVKRAATPSTKMIDEHGEPRTDRVANDAGGSTNPARTTGPPLPAVLPRCRCPRVCYNPIFPSDRDFLCDFCLVGCDGCSCAGEDNGPEGQPCCAGRGARWPPPPSPPTSPPASEDEEETEAPRMTGPPLPEVLPRCRCPRSCYDPVFPSDRDLLCDFCLVGCDDGSCAGEGNGPEGQPCCVRPRRGRASGMRRPRRTRAHRGRRAQLHGAQPHGGGTAGRKATAQYCLLRPPPVRGTKAPRQRRRQRSAGPSAAQTTITLRRIPSCRRPQQLDGFAHLGRATG